MDAIVQKIQTLKTQRQAVLLAHNYVGAAIQEIADFTGDSLELSLRARSVAAPVMVFCGVSFMAETAKILSPQSTVPLPEPDAGCPMANMASAEAVRAYKAAHPDTLLVAYVNSTAEVKAEVDLCCTSGNAERIIASIPKDRRILFLPDQNLGANLSRKLGRQMDLWPGYCPIHHQEYNRHIHCARAQYPGIVVLVHPECPPAVVSAADYALSTGQMLKFVRESNQKVFMIVTENGILHRLKRENPEKHFIESTIRPTCVDMKKITLEKVANALENLSPAVELDADLMEKARRPIERMLALS